MRRLRLVAPLPLLVAGSFRQPAVAAAQVANGSTAAVGMGENYTALARGFDAVAWNPAGLGLRGTGGSSFAALVTRGGTGIGPVTLSDLADWSNELVPPSVKRDWLARIARDGGETGSADADVTWLALQFGRFAIHASTSVRAEAALAPGITELVLFGNVDESGRPRAVQLGGSSGLVTAHSAVAASFAQPIHLEDGGRVSLGATLKYVVGHALALGDNSTGAATVDPLTVTVDFPTVHTGSDGGTFVGNGGSGFALDLGFGWEGPAGWSVGLALQNAVSSFEWDAAELRYSPLNVRLDRDTALTETDELPYSSAPAALRDRVPELTFRPVFAGGVALRASPALLVTGDVRFTSEDGIRMGVARHMGAGLEYRPVPWLPLRAGAAAISSGEHANGWQAGAGIGFDIGGWNVAASVLHRGADRLGRVTSVMLTLFGMGR